jgi:Flp pilus assembly pilin Flp
MFKLLKSFWNDENGMSTLEYIIGAGVLAGLALYVFNGVLKGSVEGASENVAGAIEQAGQQAANPSGGN